MTTRLTDVIERAQDMFGSSAPRSRVDTWEWMYAQMGAKLPPFDATGASSVFLERHPEVAASSQGSTGKRYPHD